MKSCMFGVLLFFALGAFGRGQEAGGGMVRRATSETGTVRDEGERVVYTRTAEGTGPSRFSVTWTFPDWEADTYVFLPACAYNGNRDVRRRFFPKYPPYCSKEGAGLAPKCEASQLPALEPDGSGEIEVTAGDLSVPCAGFYFPKAKRGVLIFTEQEVGGRNLGFSVKAGTLRVDYPANRHWAYRFCDKPAEWYDKPLELAKGTTIASRIRTLEFAAENVSAFHETFFRNRKCLLKSKRPPFGYTEDLWRVIEKIWNDPDESWWENCYHQEKPKFTPGWTGGLSSVYPLYLKGSAETRRRAVATVDFQVRHQAPSGFYYGCVVQGTNTVDEPHCGPLGINNKTFVRRSADALYFLCRCGNLMGWRDAWKASGIRCADAFVRNWRKYGQLGQWVNHDTGDIIVGGSTSAAAAGAALCAAARAFGRPDYLKVAEEITEDYCRRDLDRGVTYGGPGDILMAPDSESVFALLESCVALAGETKNPKWIARARQAAAQASGWVVAYTYRFPKDSTFARLGINTLGAVFANVQNKHAAPGICTFSGDSLLKLYRMTGDGAYLELCKDIAYFIPQVVSRAERPVTTPKGEALPPGYVNERVNMSDWENFGSERNVGEVFMANCWCGTALTTSFVDLATQPEIIGEEASKR